MDHVTNWEEVMDVQYTDVRVFNNPYLSTTPAVQASQTRGTAYTYQDFAETNESRTINSFEILPIFIDRADLAQSTFSKQMYWADLEGQLFQERIEAIMLGQHASWTNFGTVSIGGGGAATDQITVSATNIDDIIRGMKREIGEANGMKFAKRNGMFIIWRYTDFEILEAFMQANGFSTADMALKDGALSGARYMGVDHLVSNDHTANHLFAGVKKLGSLGILNDTYGQIVINQDPPATGAGAVSGIGVVTRLDYGLAWWNNFDSILFDINVV